MDSKLQSILRQAVQAFQDGNFETADSILHKALCFNLNCADAIFELGIAFAKADRFKEALTVFSSLHSHSRDDARIPYNMGLIHSLLGNPKAAIEAYDSALKIQPEDVSTLINKGSACNDSQNYALALRVLEEAIRIRSDIPEGWSNKGVALNNLNRYQESVNAYNEAIKLNPCYYEAWSNKSVPLKKLKRFSEAAQACDEALKLNPAYAEAHYNKGNVLSRLKYYDEALAHYDKAISLKPDYHEAWGNKGAVLHSLKYYDEALAHYDKAISLKPDYHEAAWNKSLTLLLLGDYENGLPLYESRWELEKTDGDIKKPSLIASDWLGVESLKGKTILLYGEQGLGDFIQFSRYAKLVSDLGARVILEVPKTLARLMGSLVGVSQLHIEGNQLPYFDYQCPLMSLPLALKLSSPFSPSCKSYLASNPNKVTEWKLKLGEKNKKRVGLVWSSMSNFSDDGKRSLMLKDFVKALPNNGFEYVCLQKELKDCDKQFFNDYQHIRFFGDELEDWEDTAALIDNLDLVISTCTSVPHLSGALGKETWILLSDTPDWRWLLNQSHSPLYPSVRLYRQAVSGDWDWVLEKVKEDILAFNR